MNARSTEVQRALKSNNVVELIRLMLVERERLRLHPAYTADAMCAVARGYARFVSTDTSGAVIERRTQ